MNEQTMHDFVSTTDLIRRYDRSPRTLNRWQRELGFPRPFIRGGNGSESRWRTKDVLAWEERGAPQGAAS